MATKQTLKVVTAVGEFTRTTNTAYQFAVVRNSPRAKDYFDRVESGAAKADKTGVTGRWLKDRGFAVTWHGSEAAARSAAAKPYDWDSKAELIGVFTVVA